MIIIKIVLIMILIALNAHSKQLTYDVKYRSTTLGVIKNLDTLKEYYLKVKVTNPIAKILLRKDYLVYYHDKKIDIKNAKYKHDNKAILYAFKYTIDKKPKYKKFNMGQKKYIILKCKLDKCQFISYNNSKIDAKGLIMFDNDGSFRYLTEQLSHVSIEKQD